MAQNYADALNATYSIDRRKAYLRNIELAHLHTEHALEIQLERQIKMAEMGYFFQFKGRKYFRKDINLASRFVKKMGLQAQSMTVRLETLNALNLYSIGRIDKAIRQIDTALDIFSKAPDVGISIYPYIAKLYKADFLKLDKQNIAALLQYQSVMQNVKGKLPSDHPFVAKAFRKWIGLRFEIEENGRLAEAEAAGMCECWPFEDYNSQLQPIRRFPPKMPSGTQRSGHVIVKYDVNDAGKVTKIEIVGSTSKLLNHPQSSL
ncbi:MAG: hypothetical protein JKX72_07860 [Robiginitomaculum sp.]|nr:hypothetical protein [Robiginitomaculum sp.]